MYVPPIGDRVPRRGNAFWRWFGRMVLRLGGWHFEGSIPNIPKFICVGAPHSSNWDYVWVVAGILALGIRISIMGKHTLFKGPLKPLMHWTGVIPVDRRAPAGIVGEMTRKLKESDGMLVAIAAEGTRNPGKHWKSGFWHIARAADVPVVLCGLDYGNRVVRFSEPRGMSPDLRADLDWLGSFYGGMKGARRTITLPITVKELSEGGG